MAIHGLRQATLELGTGWWSWEEVLWDCSWRKRLDLPGAGDGQRDQPLPTPSGAQMGFTVIDAPGDPVAEVLSLTGERGPMWSMRRRGSGDGGSNGSNG